MRRVLATAALAALGVAAPAGAEEHDPQGDIICRVDGYDVVLVNTGAEDLAEGTAISWAVTFARSDGTHALTRPLAPGGVIVLTGALGSSYLTSRVPCEVDQVVLPD